MRFRLLKPVAVKRRRGRRRYRCFARQPKTHIEPSRFIDLYVSGVIQAGIQGRAAVAAEIIDPGTSSRDGRDPSACIYFTNTVVIHVGDKEVASSVGANGYRAVQQSPGGGAVVAELGSSEFPAIVEIVPLGVTIRIRLFLTSAM